MTLNWLLFHPVAFLPLLLLVIATVIVWSSPDMLDYMIAKMTELTGKLTRRLQRRIRYVEAGREAVKRFDTENETTTGVIKDNK